MKRERCERCVCTECLDKIECHEQNRDMYNRIYCIDRCLEEYNKISNCYKRKDWVSILVGGHKINVREY